MDRFETLSPASAVTEQFGNAAEAGAAPKANKPRPTADHRGFNLGITRLGFMAFPPWFF
ncbi:MAG: hypothetical protein JOY83_14535 [Alphaproteobacteria bacterium]|nr:hypothetical protein [Alphaproteobacteria bacterium]